MRVGTGKAGKEEVWFSVEPLDAKSWILGVTDFNLEDKQRENRDSVRMAAATTSINRK